MPTIKEQSYLTASKAKTILKKHSIHKNVIIFQNSFCSRCANYDLSNLRVTPQVVDKFGFNQIKLIPLHPERSEGSPEFGSNQVIWRSFTAFRMTYLGSYIYGGSSYFFSRIALGMEMTPALKSCPQDKFDKLVRHFNKITAINVVSEVEKLRQIAEATIFVNKNQIHARSESQDMYQAFDLLIEKLDKQLESVDN